MSFLDQLRDNHSYQAQVLAQAIRSGNRGPVQINSFRHHVAFLPSSEQSSFYAIAGLDRNVYPPGDASLNVWVDVPDLPEPKGALQEFGEKWLPNCVGDKFEFGACFLDSFSLVPRLARDSIKSNIEGTEKDFFEIFQKTLDNLLKNPIVIIFGIAFLYSLIKK